MIYYAIKHIPTGNFLPYAKGSKGGGFTHVEPEKFPYQPRLFHREQDAKSCLTVWLKGKITVSRYGGDPYDNYECSEDWHVEKGPNRKRREFEIIPIELREVK